MDQLGQMLSPRSLKAISSLKDIPTIDIICQESLHAWMNLRRVALDYGLKYLKRHELFLPSILFSLFVTSCILLDIFVLNNFSTRPSTYNSTNKIEIEFLKLAIYCLFNIFFLFLLLVFLLYTATRINSHSEAHSHIIKKNKVLLEDIKVYRNQYFELYSTSNAERVSKKYKSLVTTDRIYKGPLSPVHGFLVNDMARRLDNDNIFEGAEQLDEVIDKQYEQLFENLQDDQEENSFRLLGQTVTVSSVNQFLLLLVSVAITMYELIGI